VSGGAGAQRNTTTIAPAGNGDVLFNINPNGGLSGTTADSLAGGNFIFFTFDAAQALDLTELSAVSDPNNGSGNNGARTAGAFVSVNGGAFTQFGSDNALNNNSTRTNTFTDTVSVDSGDTVEVRLAFTNEAGEFSTHLKQIVIRGRPIWSPFLFGLTVRFAYLLGSERS